jgi:hypothetical protein
VLCNGCGVYPIEGNFLIAAFHKHVDFCENCRYSERYKDVECNRRRYVKKDPWWAKYITPGTKEQCDSEEDCSSSEEEEGVLDEEQWQELWTPTKDHIGKDPMCTPEPMAHALAEGPTCTPEPSRATAKGRAGRTLNMNTPEKPDQTCTSSGKRSPVGDQKT